MVSFVMTTRRCANGLGEAQRGAQQFDLVQEQVLVAIRAEVGPALVASGEDHRAHRVPRLLEPAHDLQVARLVAHDPEVPKLLLQALRDGHDLGGTLGSRRTRHGHWPVAVLAASAKLIV